MSESANPVPTSQFLAEGLHDWVLAERWLHARFATPDYVTGLAFVVAIGDAAETANHHPDVTLRHGHVDVSLRSHDVGDLTRRDLALAHRITELAAEHGATSDTSAVRLLSLALDASDLEAVGRFWSAAYTGSADNVDGNDVIDPDTHELLLWLQPTDPHAEPRQRFHVDLWVAPAEAPARIAAIQAAGGTLVSDDESPAFTVLADPEGNKVCICTCLDREP